MKKLSLILILSALVFTGCFKDDDTPIIIEEVTNNITNNNNGGDDDEETCPTEVIAGGIALNTTWTADKIYILDRKVVVQSGVTLTIEPGTIIKGRAGTGSLSSALIVERGGMLNAVGTAAQPIIFTAEADNISCGETAGTNLDETNSGLWGGLLVLGNAACSLSGDVTEQQIEGIPADDTFGLYGYNDDIPEDPMDNSGTLRYISIRHGGTLLGEGNEINGLTLGGVGAGTTIDHIEVVANVDDGIEFFGGNVDASNLLVWASGDDSLDIDQAYSGAIDNAVVVLGSNSDHAFEIDGPEGSLAGSFALTNATIIGNLDTARGEYADYRSGATGSTSNVYAFGFKDSSDIELDNDGVAQNYVDGDLTFSAWEIVLPAGVTDVTTLFKNNGATVVTPGFGSEGTAVTAGSQTVGATTSALSWTYANTAGNLGF